MRIYAMKKLESHGLTSQINWLKFVQAIEEQSGAPVDINQINSCFLPYRRISLICKV